MLVHLQEESANRTGILSFMVLLKFVGGDGEEREKNWNFFFVVGQNAYQENDLVFQEDSFYSPVCYSRLQGPKISTCFEIILLKINGLLPANPPLPPTHTHILGIEHTTKECAPTRNQT